MEIVGIIFVAMMQICLLLVALNSWMSLAPASQKWCWRTRSARKKKNKRRSFRHHWVRWQSIYRSSLSCVLQVCLWISLSWSRFIFLFFLSHPLLLLSLGFGTVVVIKDMQELNVDRLRESRSTLRWTPLSLFPLPLDWGSVSPSLFLDVCLCLCPKRKK